MAFTVHQPVSQAWIGIDAECADACASVANLLECAKCKYFRLKYFRWTYAVVPQCRLGMGERDALSCLYQPLQQQRWLESKQCDAWLTESMRYLASSCRLRIRQRIYHPLLLQRWHDRTQCVITHDTPSQCDYLLLNVGLGKVSLMLYYACSACCYCNAGLKQRSALERMAHWVSAALK